MSRQQVDDHVSATDVSRMFGAANMVTTLRLLLVLATLPMAMAPFASGQARWIVPTILTMALILDGLDGYLARALQTTSRFGARFDMEVDSTLLAVAALHLVTSSRVGMWVFAVIALRPLFHGVRRLRATADLPLPESLRRKVIFVLAALLLISARLPEPFVAPIMAAAALILLLTSFAIDVVWLQRAQRRTGPSHARG